MHEAFGHKYFEQYCNNASYESSLDLHLMTYHKFCMAYAIALKTTIEQTGEWLKQQSIIDAGCAMGHIVKDLCDNGVDAEGYDFSGYAINHKVTNRIWFGTNDCELDLMHDRQYDIIYSNSFQYTFDNNQLRNWLCQARRICRHSMLFCSLVQNNMETCITSSVEKIQIIRPREWWTAMFENAGFKNIRWVNAVNAVCFKNRRK